MTTTVAEAQWLGDWNDWHAARESAVAGPHGIAANTGTTWLGDEPVEVPGVPGAWLQRDGRAVPTALDASLGAGEEIAYGDKLVKVIAPRPGTLAVRVFDPDAPGRVGLTGIGAFEPTPGWIVRGRFEPAAPGATAAIEHADGVTTSDRVAGVVHVDVAGDHVHVLVWPSAEPGLLEFTFADKTNGVSTQQFRFLKVRAPGADGVVELDFNRAYLPPCALGEGYLCPIPPLQNRLPFAVEAGERFPLR